MQEQLPASNKLVLRGHTFGVVGKTAHLNPGTELALIRLCKHALSLLQRADAHTTPRIK